MHIHNSNCNFDCETDPKPKSGKELAEWLFRLHCQYGHLEEAKELMYGDLFPNKHSFALIKSINNIIDRNWFCKHYDIDINTEDGYAFRLACMYNHLPVAQWLHSIGANIHTKNDFAICRSSQKRMIEWLITLDTYSHDIIRTVFKNICLFGYNDTAKLVYEKYGGDIDHDFLKGMEVNPDNLELKNWIDKIINEECFMEKRIHNLESLLQKSSFI